MVLKLGRLKLEQQLLMIQPKHMMMGLKLMSHMKLALQLVM
jgi:hypothetical protein